MTTYVQIIMIFSEIFIIFIHYLLRYYKKRGFVTKFLLDFPLKKEHFLVIFKLNRLILSTENDFFYKLLVETFD